MIWTIFRFVSVTLLIVYHCLFFGVDDVRAQELQADEPVISSQSADSDYQFPKDEFVTGEVIGIIKEGTEEISGYTRDYQVLAVRLLDGDAKGKTIELEQGQISSVTAGVKAQKGERVVLAKTTIEGESSYAIIDRYRLDPLLYLCIGFVVLIVVFGRKKGLMSILGLGVSVVVISQFMIPQILTGQNPLLITITGLLMIAFVSLYVAHGFSVRTTISLVSTLITLGIAIVLSLIVVNLTKLSGLGTEEAFFLQLGPLGRLNLQGLLLGGILIGTLGVLDDITTAQTAAVEEIGKANGTLDFKELYTRGISVGYEHIASLVNTLFLAYAGSSLPLFILFSANKDQQPLWLTLNSEQVVEEVIRTLVGSSALILAVPITTLLAAYYYGAKKAVKVNSTA
jgi:uncharacterized membrane protein